MGFSLGALGVGRMPRARPARGAAAGGVDRDGARRAEPLRDHLRRVQRRLRPGGQAARRASDQDRGQRRVAADGRRDLRGGPGQRAVAVRRRAPARAGVAGQPGVVARDRPSHPDRAGRAGPRPRATSCCCRRRSPARRRSRCSTSCGAVFPKLPARHLRPDVAGGAARGEPAAVTARPWCRTTASIARASSWRWRPTSSGPGWRRSSSRASGRGGGTGQTGATARSTCSAKPGVSVTGSNADLRLAVAPSELGAVAVALLAAVGRRVGDAGLVGPAVAGLGRAARHAAAIERTAEALVRSRGESLVVSGSDDVATQIVVGEAERRSWATSARPSISARPSLQRQGDDAALAALIDDMNRGAVHALLLWGANPVYDHPDGVAFRAGAAEGRAVDLVRRSPRRDQRPRPRGLPGPPFPRGVGRRRAGQRALQPAAAADRAAARHARGGREPADVGGPPDRPPHPPARILAARALPARGRGGRRLRGLLGAGARAGRDRSSSPAGGDARVRGRLEEAVRAIVSRANRAGQLDDADTGYELALARDRRRARRAPRQQPVAAGAARSDDAPDLGQRRVAWRPRPRRRWASRPATSSR